MNSNATGMVAVLDWVRVVICYTPFWLPVPGHFVILFAVTSHLMAIRRYR